jgi:hypothetical protein
MHDAPVFLITTGRTGSTLLQRLLNCHRDLVVWGEHHGLFATLAGPYRLMAAGTGASYPTSASDNPGPDLLLPGLRDPSAPLEWANPWSFEEVKPQIADFLKGYFASRIAPTQRWGFKEVRYNRTDALDMLRDLFPRGQFLFLRRNPLEVARSKVLAWKKGEPWESLPLAERLQRTDAIVQEIRGHYAIYDEFMARNPDACLAVDFENLVGDTDATLAALLGHLQLDPTGYDRETAGKVLAQVITSTRT